MPGSSVFRSVPRGKWRATRPFSARNGRAFGLLDTQLRITLINSTLGVLLTQRESAMSGDAVGWMTELDPHTRRLVAAFRNAASALQEERDFGAAVENELADVVGWPRCRAVIPHFRTLMETIGLHARREVRFHVPACPCLGADEAAFVRLHARVAAGALAEAEVIAQDLVEQHAIMTVLHYTSLLAARCPGGAAREGGADGEPMTADRATGDKPAGGRLH